MWKGGEQSREKACSQNIALKGKTKLQVSFISHKIRQIRLEIIQFIHSFI